MLNSFIENGEQKYRCDCCDTVYDGLPLCFGGGFPAYLQTIPTDEFEKRVVLTESLCIVDDEYFFHRGFLEIPILETDDFLIFDVWTSISQDNFYKREDDWENPQRIHNEPYFGWLQNQIPFIEKTISIQMLAYENEVGEVPSFFVIEENHPLKTMQEQGISLEFAQNWVGKILAQHHQSNQ